jgi:hypothetical protein
VEGEKLCLAYGVFSEMESSEKPGASGKGVYGNSITEKPDPVLDPSLGRELRPNGVQAKGRVREGYALSMATPGAI